MRNIKQKLSHLLIQLILQLALPSFLLAQTNENTTLVGHWGYINGAVHDITTNNGKVYFGAGTSLKIVDYSDDSTLTLLGEIPLSVEVNDVCANDEYAFTIGETWNNHTEFDIINISNPEDPTLVSRSYFDYGNAWSLIAASNLVCIADVFGFNIVDVSNPEEPVVAGRFSAPTSFAGDLVGIDMNGNHAFLARGQAGLHIVDISNPAEPAEVGLIVTPSSANDVAVSGNYAFVATNTNGLVIVNISNPAVPMIESSLPLGNLRRVTIDENILVTGGSEGHIYLYDITNPVSPTQMDSVAVDAFVAGLSFTPDCMFSNCEAGLRQYDTSDLSNVTISNTFSTQGSSSKISIVDNLAFIADGYAGWKVLDVTDPANPVLIHAEDSDKFVSNVESDDNKLFVMESGHEGRLRIYDVSDLTAPIELGSRTTDGASAIVVVDTLAFLTEYYFGLRVLDISDPAQPVSLGYYSGSGMNDINISDTHAYIAKDNSGMLILDISDPSNPVYVGDSYPFYPGSIEVINEIAIIAGHDDSYNYSLRIMDISDPQNQEMISEVSLPAAVYDLSASGDIVTLACGTNGIYLHDISNLTSPVQVGWYNTNGASRGVFSSGNLIYVADGPNGVDIIQYENNDGVETNHPKYPNQYQLAQNYPNPFNPVTTIKYNLPERGLVHLTVYNQLGQPVRRIVNREETPGQKSVIWDSQDNMGRQMSAGIYFYQLEVNGFTQTCKMVMLK